MLTSKGDGTAFTNARAVDGPTGCREDGNGVARCAVANKNQTEAAPFSTARQQQGVHRPSDARIGPLGGVFSHKLNR
jgi:hypothetical protein